MTTSPPDFSQASWRLKLVRAEHHFEELERTIRAYSDTRPYRAERVLDSQADRDVWRFRLVMPEKPDPQIAIILGDVVHNIRSALDHLAVALAPPNRKKSAGFPIENFDFWAKDGRTYRRRDRGAIQSRTAFRRRTRGMHRRAQAFIKALQPYRQPDPKDNSLYLINRFENADKHRELISANFGLHDVIVSAYIGRPGNGARLPERNYGFCENGAKLFETTPPDGFTLDSEVHVEVAGAPAITFDLGFAGESTDIIETLRELLKNVRMYILPVLEPLIPPE